MLNLIAFSLYKGSGVYTSNYISNYASNLGLLDLDDVIYWMHCFCALMLFGGAIFCGHFLVVGEYECFAAHFKRAATLQ